MLRGNKKFEKELIKAEQGNAISRQVIVELLRPNQNDTLDEAIEKRTIFKRLFYLKSLEYADAPYHYDIRQTYAENGLSMLKNGYPKYNNIMIVGFRESAKTTEIMINETYDILYFPDYYKLNQVSAYSNKPMEDIITDIRDSLAFSKINLYFPDLIKLTSKRTDKFERQSTDEFNTTTGVKYTGTTIRTTKRGARSQEIDEFGEIKHIRPNKNIFEDFENETTIDSLPETEKIKSVILATLDGADQKKSINIFSANLLTDEGVVAYFMNKFRNDEKSKVIEIPVIKDGKPYWPAKYCLTDQEAMETGKISIEKMKRERPNFETEFMLNPSAEEKFFNLERLDEMELKAPDEPITIIGGLKIYQEYEAGGKYGIGADVGKGIGRDSSVSQAIRFDTIPAVNNAVFESNTISPADFGVELSKHGNYFGGCIIAPENNYETATILSLSQHYRNIFKQQSGKVKQYDNGSNILGWNTNKLTRSLMLNDLKDAIHKGLLIILDKATIRELKRFTKNNAERIEEKGLSTHFDRVIALAIAWQMRKYAMETKKYDYDMSIENQGQRFDRVGI